MATEQSSKTVIRVYTSNCPPADDTEYVKRSGRAQGERSGGDAEENAKAHNALLGRLRAGGLRGKKRAPAEEARSAEHGAPGGRPHGTAQRDPGSDGNAHGAARQDVGSGGGTRRTARRHNGRIWPNAARRRPGRRARAVSRPDYMKRMSRSTLIVCAVIMGVAAVRALPFDWAQQAVTAMSGAVNMSVDLDKTLGELKFVREVIPDSAMVFWSGGAGEYSAPFSGNVTHAFSEEQPWLEYSGQNQQVRSVRSGRVVQLEQGDAGDWAVRIEHADGMETVYAFLSDTSVQEGDSVAAAQEIGRASGANGARIYFEMRVDGKPVDPSPYLGKL